MTKTVRAALAALTVAALAAGCSDDSADTKPDSSGDAGTSQTSTEPTGPLPTVDDVVAALQDAGLCQKMAPPTVSAALAEGNPLLPKVTKSVHCDKHTEQALEISGFATAADRDAAVEDGFGDNYHYAGTGENLWILEVDADEVIDPVERILAGQLEQL